MPCCDDRLAGLAERDSHTQLAVDGQRLYAAFRSGNCQLLQQGQGLLSQSGYGLYRPSALERISMGWRLHLLEELVGVA
jgi:hypothetical protein